MCIATPTSSSPSSAPSPRMPDAECLLPPPPTLGDPARTSLSPATSSPTVREGFPPITQGSFQACSTFNSLLARAKTKAIECLLRICENADNSASPADIRRAATAILRCSPLHDDDQLQPQRTRPRLNIPDKPPIIQPTPAPPPIFGGTGLPTGAEEITDNAPCSNDETTPSAHTPPPPAPPSPPPRVPDAECRVSLAPVAQSAAPPPPAPTIARLLGNPAPQALTPSSDEIFRALAALEALRKSDPERHQSLDPGNTLQPLIDFIRSVYPAAGLPPDHPLSIAIRDIESAYSAAERQTAALDEALADLRATAPSASTPIHDPPDRNSPSNQHDLDPPPGPCAFDVAPNAYTFASSPDARGPPEPTAA